MKNNWTKFHERLYQEWKVHGKIIIATDFDDTISPWKFKSIEDLSFIDKTINLLRISKETGAYIVIFTACNKDRYKEIEEYCKSKRLDIDAINITPISLPYGRDGKVYANLFIDDRAGLNESLEILETVMYKIRGERASNLTTGEHG